MRAEEDAAAGSPLKLTKAERELEASGISVAPPRQIRLSAVPDFSPMPTLPAVREQDTQEEDSDSDEGDNDSNNHDHNNDHSNNSDHDSNKGSQDSSNSSSSNGNEESSSSDSDDNTECNNTLVTNHPYDLRLSFLTYANNPSPVQITLRRPYQHRTQKHLLFLDSPRLPPLVLTLPTHNNIQL
ncbi:hypothetical protein K443DRAFT_10747 [Laccaria amethystina LaAM-08-1]|uniref:Uncharacterized protein n=1 Tax=Laccaria amethystina LaAM-08-1 TaxID=1095629 RepID=A0A0C9WV54_9AGAR|nr:hypothetical protein K443DRAFT_10747 [Laccaria amethystina LaAM-08-1]